jgi:hypothetical protein
LGGGVEELGQCGKVKRREEGGGGGRKKWDNLRG